jgi:hypothetical protein
MGCAAGGNGDMGIGSKNHRCGIWEPGTESKKPVPQAVAWRSWWGRALPPANRSDQELAGESACPTFFDKVSRAAGPSQQTGLPRISGKRRRESMAVFRGSAPQPTDNTRLVGSQKAADLAANTSRLLSRMASPRRPWLVSPRSVVGPTDREGLAIGLRGGQEDAWRQARETAGVAV